MKKKWLFGAAVLAVLAGGGVAVITGALPLPGGPAVARSDATQPKSAKSEKGEKSERGEKGDKKPRRAARVRGP